MRLQRSAPGSGIPRSSSCGITPVILTPAELAEELRSPVARSLGLSPRTVFFMSAVCKNSSILDTTWAEAAARQSSILISFRLDDYIPWTKPHPVGNRLFVSAIEQTQGDQSKARPKPSARAVNAVPRGLRHRLRQLIFARRRTLRHGIKPYESLPSAESERLAKRDRAQKLELWRPARVPPAP